MSSCVCVNRAYPKLESEVYEIEAGATSGRC